MNPISFLNLIACFGFVLALIFLWRNRLAAGALSFPLLLSILSFGLLAAVSGFLSWSGISDALALLESYSYVILPLIFFGLFTLAIYQERSTLLASRTQVLAAIHAVTERETHPEDPFGAVRDMLGRVGTLLRFDLAGIFQRQGDERTILAVAWNLDATLASGLDGIDSSITLARVIEGGEPLVVARTANFPDPLTQVMNRNGLTSLALFPLTTRSRTQGVLLLGSREAFHISEEVNDLLKFLGRHLGEVLLNNQLQEEARERSADLSGAVESRRLFLSMVSHDLRDPLNIIKGAMLVIHQYFDKSTSEEVRRAVEMASSSSRRLEKLIGDMIDLARLGSGGIRLEFAPVDPVAELRALGEEFRQEAGRKGVALEYALPPRLPPVEVDKARFHQMVRNLISNGVRFTPEGGRVTLSADTEGENVLVRVADTGVGILPQELPRVFDMFFRGSATEKDQGGAGLGLSIVREVVRLHGGRIAAESDPGKGTTFTVTLPRVHLP